MSQTYTVRAIPDGKYWALEIPELDQYTMATSVKEIRSMAQDFITVVTGEQNPQLNIQYAIPSEVEESLQLKAEAKRIEQEAQTKQRQAALSLHNKGMTLRDIGTLLGISYQRVHQLLRTTVSV